MRCVNCLIVSIATLSVVVGAFDLQCSESSNERNRPIDEVFVECVVKNLFIIERGEVMRSASSVKDIESIERLYIQQQIVKYVPKFADSLAQGIESLEINKCQLKTIDRDDLQQFLNLRELRLGRNDLQWLDSDLLESTPDIQIVDFSDNHLKFIGTNLLRPLANLEQAWFENAECIDFNAETPTELETLKSVLTVKCKPREMLNVMRDIRKIMHKYKELEEEKNELEEEIREQEENFGKMVNCNQKFEDLIEVHEQHVPTLRDNQTVNILCNNFLIETKVCEVVGLKVEDLKTKIGSIIDLNGVKVWPTSLIIQDQQVMFVPRNLFKVVPNLKHLEISQSNLRIADWEAFKGLDKLESLVLTGNQIWNIAEGSFAHLKSLEMLDLSSSNINWIASGAFLGLGALKVLNLSNNDLTIIDENFLAPLVSLVSLDLSGNPCIDARHPETSLEEIVDEVIDDCVPPINFDCITLDEQNICRVENFTFDRPIGKMWKLENAVAAQSNVDITTLVIKDQPMKILPRQLTENFENLQRLFIIRSQLTALGKKVFVELENLKWIEIRGNNITLIDEEAFNSVPQVEQLDLSSNHIQSLPPKIFERLTNLKELQMSFNEIQNLNANILPATNAIKVFKIDNNKLDRIDTNILRLLSKSDLIDFSDNICIDSKFHSTHPNKMRALFVAIYSSCYA